MPIHILIHNTALKLVSPQMHGHSRISAGEFRPRELVHVIAIPTYLIIAIRLYKYLVTIIERGYLSLY